MAVVEGMPDLFGDEGHEGREHAQRGLEDPIEEEERHHPILFRFAGFDAQLHQFQVPVAEVAPEELIDGVGGFVEAVDFECGIDGICRGVEAREDPAVFET